MCEHAGHLDIAVMPVDTPVWNDARAELAKRTGFCTMCATHFPVTGEIELPDSLDLDQAPSKWCEIIGVLLGVGALFLLLSPVFWMGTELPKGQRISAAYENAGLYHRVYPACRFGFGRMR